MAGVGAEGGEARLGFGQAVQLQLALAEVHHRPAADDVRVEPEVGGVPAGAAQFQQAGQQRRGGREVIGQVAVAGEGPQDRRLVEVPAGGQAAGGGAVQRAAVVLVRHAEQVLDERADAGRRGLVPVEAGLEGRRRCAENLVAPGVVQEQQVAAEFDREADSIRAVAQFGLDQAVAEANLIGRQLVQVGVPDDRGFQRAGGVPEAGGDGVRGGGERGVQAAAEAEGVVPAEQPPLAVGRAEGGAVGDELLLHEQGVGEDPGVRNRAGDTERGRFGKRLIRVEPQNPAGGRGVEGGVVGGGEVVRPREGDDGRAAIAGDADGVVGRAGIDDDEVGGGDPGGGEGGGQVAGVVVGHEAGGQVGGGHGGGGPAGAAESGGAGPGYRTVKPFDNGKVCTTPTGYGIRPPRPDNLTSLACALSRPGVKFARADPAGPGRAARLRLARPPGPSNDPVSAGVFEAGAVS